MSESIALSLKGRSDDELGAQFERAFGWAAPPFEGAYLDPEGTIGGAATDTLWELFRACGFQPNIRSVDVEHLATALRCLAFTSGAEADAVEDGHQGAIERTRALARQMLDEHLLRWVPLWASAVLRTEDLFPIALADQIESLLLSHRAALGGKPRAFDLPDVPPLLDEESTGLREIGVWLSKPALSGMVLTRIDLQRIGRQLEVPRGFGERSQLVINLLRSSARFEVFGRSIEMLEAELDDQIEALREPRLDVARDLLSTWTRRAAHTRSVLRRLVEEAITAEAELDQEPAPSPEADAD